MLVREAVGVAKDEAHDVAVFAKEGGYDVDARMWDLRSKRLLEIWLRLGNL